MAERIDQGAFYFVVFLLFDRAAGFLPPRPRIVAGRRAQIAVKAGRSSAATPSGCPGLYSNRARRQACGVGSITLLSIIYPSSFQRALFRWRMYLFWQALLRSPWRVRCSHQLISGSSDPACQGAACMDDRAGGMGLIFGTADRQVPICDAHQQPHIRPARHTRLRCRNSANCRRYRVRIAPCGTRPCSR